MCAAHKKATYTERFLGVFGEKNSYKLKQCQCDGTLDRIITQSFPWTVNRWRRFKTLCSTLDPAES